MTPVLVLASSPAARRGLAGLLAASEDFDCSGQANWAIDDLTVDAELVLGELVQGDRLPLFSLPVLLLTDRRDIVFEPGPGRGLLGRQAEDGTVLAALRAVREGLWVTDRPTQRGDLSQGLEALTAREIEVLELLAEGLGNKQLAATLGISENTVKFHLSSIFSKLDVGSRTEAVTAGIRSGYLLV